jgi:hypothetical protein
MPEFRRFTNVDGAIFNLNVNLIMHIEPYSSDETQVYIVGRERTILVKASFDETMAIIQQSG